MNIALLGVTAVPTIVALLVFCVFSYLYSQSRESYFRAWQFAWLAYLSHLLVLTWIAVGLAPGIAHWLADLLLIVTALCIFASARLVKKEYKVQRGDVAIALAGFFWATISALRGQSPWNIVEGVPFPRVPVAVGIAGLLLFTAWRFFEIGHRRDSFANRLLAISIVVWAGILLVRHSELLLQIVFGGLGSYLAPVPQMLIAISMVVVLFDNERRSVQENLLAFSKLDVEASHVMTPTELAPYVERFLERLAMLADCQRVAICIMDQWSEVFPAVQRGFAAEFLPKLRETGAADLLGSITYRRGGLAIFRDMDQDLATLQSDRERAGALRGLIRGENVRGLTAVSLQTHDRNFGVLLFAHPGFGSSQLRLLMGLAMQIGMTMENHLLMYNAHRRTQEYELLTQVGQAVSSRLDSDEVLRAVHKELGVLFDTRNFYVALMQGSEVRYEFEIEDGQPQPKRTRNAADGLTEHIIRTGKPVLVRSKMEDFRKEVGVTAQGRPACCYLGVPIFRYEKAVGVMAAMNYEREMVYDKRDLEVMQTAAQQVSVAMENARLFEDEQRRARHLSFLNNVSRLAISSESAEQMVAEIVSEIQTNFKYDHIGIGMLDYATKEIEIKAEAGSTAQALGRRVPLGVGILGKCARSCDVALVQNASGGALASILPGARSVLCIPISYGETLLGVLNIESEREQAFSEQEVLIFRTLADLLATALHNAFVFQKMQQQSMTDALTGIKTRRFFLEALQAEWKRAARTGRPFSVVLIDLDGFKQVNDGMGHLEGDLVLARIGRLLEQKCRQSNVVARYGGDEFVILMPETTVEQAQILAERLRLWISTDPMLNERQITGSFGVATFPQHGSTAEDIIRVADAGMYVSKRAGGNHVSIAQEFSTDDSAVDEKRMVTSYVEGLLQRDYSGPDGVSELLSQLGSLNNLVKSGRNKDVMMEAVRLLTASAETREISGNGHGEATARFAGAIAQELGIVGDELDDIIFAARVHDVGKIFVPDKTLNKPAPLTEEEMRVVKSHSTSGAALVDLIPGSERLRLLVRHHHERVDGSGYPDRLKGEQIPLGSRIIAVAEGYTTMTSERPYAQVWTSQDALAHMEAVSGTQFDGMLVRMLRQFIRGAAAQTATASR